MKYIFAVLMALPVSLVISSAYGMTCSDVFSVAAGKVEISPIRRYAILPVAPEKLPKDIQPRLERLAEKHASFANWKTKFSAFDSRSLQRYLQTGISGTAAKKVLREQIRTMLATIDELSADVVLRNARLRDDQPREIFLLGGLGDRSVPSIDAEGVVGFLSAASFERRKLEWIPHETKDLFLRAFPEASLLTLKLGDKTLLRRMTTEAVKLQRYELALTMAEALGDSALLYDLGRVAIYDFFFIGKHIESGNEGVAALARVTGPERVKAQAVLREIADQLSKLLRKRDESIGKYKPTHVAALALQAYTSIGSGQRQYVNSGRADFVLSTEDPKIVRAIWELTREFPGTSWSVYGRAAIKDPKLVVRAEELLSQVAPQDVYSNQGLHEFHPGEFHQLLQVLNSKDLNHRYLARLLEFSAQAKNGLVRQRRLAAVSNALEVLDSKEFETQFQEQLKSCAQDLARMPLSDDVERAKSFVTWMQTSKGLKENSGRVNDRGLVDHLVQAAGKPQGERQQLREAGFAWLHADEKLPVDRRAFFEAADREGMLLSGDRSLEENYLEEALKSYEAAARLVPVR